MSPRYFTGQQITGAVSAHHAATFAAMVNQLIMVPQVLPIRYVTYHALRARVADESLSRDERKVAKKAADAAKSVPYLTPAVFSESPSSRDTEHATYCNLICLDMDDGAEPFLQNPDTLARQLAPWSYVAYQTASSTPQAPRMRLIVDAEAIPKDLYRAAVETISARLGLRHITRESLVPAQPMYLPSVFNDQGESEHPVFSHRTDGQSFRVHDIDHEASTPTAAGEARRQRLPQSGGDVLEYLRAPVPEITLDNVAAILEFLDPDMPRPQWLEVAAGMRHQFDGDDEQEAYELFDTWSEGGRKYEGPEDTGSKWKSFRTTPAGRVPVTIRSILHYATRAGWDNGKVKASVFARIREWIDDPERTVTDLATEGLKQIATAPLLTASEEDMLLRRIVGRSAKMGSAVGAGSLRKDLAKLRASLKDKREEPAAPPWALGWCYVTGHDEFYRHRTAEKVKRPAFDTTYSRWLLPTQEDLVALGLPVNAGTLSRPTVLPTQFLTNTLKVQTAHGYDYNPSKPQEIFFEEKGCTYVNTYVRNHPESDPKGSAAAGRMLLAHLGVLIAEPEYRRIMLDFMAYCVQFPGEKVRWAPLIQSEEGAGKTVLFEIMSAVLGEANARCLDGGALFKGYSEWAVGSMFIALEEIRITGADRFAVMNVLKPIITNKWINVEQRYEDSRQRINRTNYILFTNFHDAIALKPGDRRYFVLKSRLQNMAQVLALGGPAYFDPIYDVIRENAGGLRHFLENWQISEHFSPSGHAPATTYRQQLIVDSASEASATVRQIVQESTSCLVQPDLLSSRILYDLMRGEGMTRLTHQGLGRVLMEDGYVHAGRWQLDGTQHNMWLHNSAAVGVPEARVLAFERAELGKLGPGAHLLL